MTKAGVLGQILTILTLSGAAAAQTPSGLLEKSTATTGKTDVAAEGFEKRIDAGESNDATELSFNAGAFLASGNSRSVAATFAEQFRLRRDVHQLSLSSSVNYGRSAPDAESGLQTTVENYQARTRYDLFLGKGVALFLGVSARKDRFQGLDLRLNVAPGVAYYFIDDPAHQLWTELGYNLQYDLRSDEVIETAEDEGIAVAEHETRHFARAFVGYNNKLNDAVTFTTGFEYLLGISPFEDEETGRNNWRISWTAGFTSKVSDKLSVATTLGVDHDNNPLPGVRRTDATTAINLVYTLL
jgi:putative salt-induced outer membrane protein